MQNQLKCVHLFSVFYQSFNNVFILDLFIFELALQQLSQHYKMEMKE